MPAVSVIIPVYNASAYISRCLDSIMEQTYTDFEVICVNDESTDNSCEILKGYMEKYPGRINLISQKNSGAGESRNHGIQEARGKYLFFVDNDDYIDKDYIEKFMEAAEKTNADMVLGGYRHVYENGHCFFSETLADNPDWAPFKRIAPWGRTYRREFLIDNNLGFLKSKIGEDFFINARAAVLSSKTVIIDYTGYNWFFNRKSLSNNHHLDPKLDQIALEMLRAVYISVDAEKLSPEKYMRLEYLFIKFAVYYILFYGRKFSRDHILKSYEKFFNALKEMFPGYRKNKLVGIFTPEGEDFKIRLSVFLFMILDKLSLWKILRFYAKGEA